MLPTWLAEQPIEYWMTGPMAETPDNERAFTLELTDVASLERSPPPIPRILEALLFVGGAPLTAERAAVAVRGLTESQLTQAIDGLNRDYRRQGRPYFIQAHEHGYVLTLRPRYRAVVEKLYGPAREARLSPAAIDVLALVAY